MTQSLKNAAEGFIIHKCFDGDFEHMLTVIIQGNCHPTVSFETRNVISYFMFSVFKNK